MGVCGSTRDEFRRTNLLRAQRTEFMSPDEGRNMVARGGAAQQRNPGKDEKYFGTPSGVA